LLFDLVKHIDHERGSDRGENSALKRRLRIAPGPTRKMKTMVSGPTEAANL
jgi:hypothetical protein